MECEGIGPERAEAIAEWFADEDNLRLVEELRALGLRFESGEEDRPVEGPLTGNQYVITGTLESLSREERARGARGARREGLRQRLEEDDRRVRRREPRLEGREGAEGRRAAPRGDGPARANRPLRRARARSRSGPAPCARRRTRPGSRSAARRTRSGRARSPRARTPRRSCPSSRARRRAPARRSMPVLERARLARDGQRRPERVLERRVVPRGDEERRDRRRGQAVERARGPSRRRSRRPRAGRSPPPGRGARRRRRRRTSAVAALGAELLEQHLGAEVVALAVHHGEHVRKRRRLDLAERRRGDRRAADRRRRRSCTPKRAQQPAERPGRRERGVERDVVVVLARGRRRAPRAAGTRR